MKIREQARWIKILKLFLRLSHVPPTFTLDLTRVRVTQMDSGGSISVFQAKVVLDCRGRIRGSVAPFTNGATLVFCAPAYTQYL